MQKTNELFEYVLTKQLSVNELEKCAEWITQTHELPTISSSTGVILTSQELKAWIKTSEQCILTKYAGEIIGIATLSTVEVHLPNQTVELCHCIVRPNYRRHYSGTKMLKKLCSYAKTQGFKDVVGRVENSNNLGILLMQSLDFIPMNENLSNQNTITWYHKNL